MRIKILRSARRDLISGYWFYENQSRGLGEFFRDSVMSDIESLLVYGGIHPLVHGKRRKIASRFPYSIFYVVENDEIRIHAVIDDRSDPRLTSDRLT